MKEQKFYITVVDSSNISKDFEFWGMGESKEDALNDAIEQIKEHGNFICTYECSKSLYDFMEKHGGMAASKNYFQHLDDDFLDLYPNRDTLYEFCEKHNLSEEAKRDLQGFFDFELNKEDD